ncbi:hypothetical protein, partial [Streptomyces europaeiscabiei]|uniref:hypothetical protein n=1 Tax=Streptomyces europaeiscabiei TaxID=146819 RepID=UPI0038F7F0A3
MTKAGKVAELDALRADYLVRSKVFSDKIITFSLMLRKHNEIIWSMEVSADRLHIHNSFRILAKQIAMSLADRIERLNVALEPQ